MSPAFMKAVARPMLSLPPATSPEYSSSCARDSVRPASSVFVAVRVMRAVHDGRSVSERVFKTSNPFALNTLLLPDSPP